MLKSHWFFAACCLLSLLVCNVSAAVYPVDSTITVSLKYNNGDPAASDTFMRMVTGKPSAGKMDIEVAPPDPEKELTNVLTVTKGDKEYKKTLQTAPQSTVIVDSPAEDVVDVAQTSTMAGYPVLELYWDYDKSPNEPWRYYMRVDKVEGGYATMADFKSGIVWRKPMTREQVNAIINSGTIPDWESVR